jgi:hypothetical protein
VPIKSRQLCIELQGRRMWSAGVEPATRRVSDGRSPLSYDHAEWARLDSNQRQPVCWTGALALLSYSPASSTIRIRDKGSNLGLHIQSVASCRLDDPGMVVPSCACHVRRKPNDVVQATRLPFGPGSRARSIERRPTWRGFGAGRSCLFGNSQAKAAAYSAANSACAKRRGAFLS